MSTSITAPPQRCWLVLLISDNQQRPFVFPPWPVIGLVSSVVSIKTNEPTDYYYTLGLKVTMSELCRAFSDKKIPGDLLSGKLLRIGQEVLLVDGYSRAEKEDDGVIVDIYQVLPFD